MDEVFSRHQQGPAPAPGRVFRFPDPTPWRNGRRGNKPRRSAAPVLAAPTLPMPGRLGLGGMCRRGLHQLGPLGLIATSRGGACRECFQSAIRSYG